MGKTIVFAALLASVAAPAFAAEADTIAAAVAGSWRNAAGGTCEAAYMKTAARANTARGEQAMAATVVSAGTTINALLILQGAREGQIVNPMSDKAIFLVEPQEGNKLHVIPIGEPALSWTEVTLDLCPGSR
jgi:hypothetical protein